MRRIASAGLLLAALVFPAAALSAAADAHGDGAQPVAQADQPAQRTETKPFNPHASHPATAQAAQTTPWYDTSALPIPILADDLGDH